MPSVVTNADDWDTTVLESPIIHPPVLTACALAPASPPRRCSRHPCSVLQQRCVDLVQGLQRVRGGVLAGHALLQVLDRLAQAARQQQKYSREAWWR